IHGHDQLALQGILAWRGFVVIVAIVTVRGTRLLAVIPLVTITAPVISAIIVEGAESALRLGRETALHRLLGTTAVDAAGTAAGEAAHADRAPRGGLAVTLARFDRASRVTLAVGTAAGDGPGAAAGGPLGTLHHSFAAIVAQEVRLRLLLGNRR